MNAGQSLVGFAGAAGLLTVTPGMSTALVLRTAVAEGPYRAILAAAGVCLSYPAWALAMAIGFWALYSAPHSAREILRVLGACYLAGFGLKLAFGRPPRSQEGAEPGLRAGGRRGRWSCLATGFATNVANPQVGVFYATLVPQFVPRGAGASFGMILSSIQALETLLWFLALICAAKLLSGWLKRPAVAKTLDRLTGILLIAFGAKLAFA